MRSRATQGPTESLRDRPCVRAVRAVRALVQRRGAVSSVPAVPTVSPIPAVSALSALSAVPGELWMLRPGPVWMCQVRRACGIAARSPTRAGASATADRAPAQRPVIVVQQQQ